LGPEVGALETAAMLDADLALRRWDQELEFEDNAFGVNLKTAYVNTFAVSSCHQKHKG